MSDYIHKSHNVSVLIYPLVLPAKYRRAVFDKQVDLVMKQVCLEIEKRYPLRFLELGTAKHHVHCLVHSVPTWAVTKIVTRLKRVTAREIFRPWPQLKNSYGAASFGQMALLPAPSASMATKRRWRAI